MLFMGMPAYLPNKQAIEILIKKIMPTIVRRHLNVKLIVVGGKINYKNTFLINPGLIDFDELPKLIKCCDIGLAPIFSGSGTRMKILEYMAAGIPVVSTEKGAEGLEIKDGKNILIGNSYREIINQIEKLISHKQLRKKIGNNGKFLVKKLYSYKNIVRNFEKYILNMKI